MNPQIIRAAVATYYGISQRNMLGPGNHRHLSIPRMLCMWLMRRHTVLSLGEIGVELGGRHHSTVLIDIRRIEKRLETWPKLQKARDAIERKLTNGGAGENAA